MEILEVQEFSYGLNDSNDVDFISALIDIEEDGEAKQIDFSGYQFETLKSTVKIKEVLDNTDPALWVIDFEANMPVKGVYSCSMPLNKEMFLEILEASTWSTDQRLVFEAEKNVSCYAYVLNFVNAYLKVYPNRLQVLNSEID